MSERPKSSHPLYKVWRGMIARCENQNEPAYHRYGGRGIKVCERWHDLNAFAADMGERPLGKTLDRFPNNDGNYEPGNCRWATMREQNNNREDNVPLTIGGATKNIAEWASEAGIATTTLEKRIALGWAANDLLRPSRPQKDRTHCPRGHAYTEANTVHTPHKRTKRRCRACVSIRNKAWKAKHRIRATS